MNNPSVKLGLKENWKQFSLLVIINSFVGGMIGLERSILPEIAGLTLMSAIIIYFRMPLNKPSQ